MDWSLLYKESPYDGFDHSKYDLEIQGWGWDSPTFQTLIERVRPRLIIEVGSWKGASAIHMASICKDLGLETKIICIDTWLGAHEMWFSPCETRSLRRVNGFPQIYPQFLANVVKSNHQDTIIPMPITSRIGSQILSDLGLKADLIYIDGSHEYPDVLSDLKSYRPLVAEGGVMFGDDYADCWLGVKQAVDEFSQSEGVPLSVEGVVWMFDYTLNFSL